jgi:predicted phage tail protein
MQLKKIKVYGKLRQFLGKSYFEAAVRSPKQAMSFLMANFEGLQKHMNDQYYKIKMGNETITEEYFSMSGQGDIQIIPVACGAAPFIFGAGLIGGGAYAASFAEATFLGAGFISGIFASSLTAVGVSMIVGGVVGLLSPQPSFGDISDIDPRIRGSYAFNGIQNVNSSGVPVPIIYGLVFSGSILISSGVDTAQIRQSIT